MTNLLSLEQFRRIVKMHPYHFWQLAGDSVPLESMCDDLLFEEDWQNADAMSRSAIRQAISVAERKLREWLGYDVAPRYHVDTVDYPRLSYQSQLRGANVNAIGESIGLQLPWGQLRSVGALARTLISGSVALTFADTNGDGLSDTFKAIVAVPGITDASQIAAFFGAADRWDVLAPLEDWKIEPATVSIANGTATIQGNIWQVVRPALYADLTDARRYYDPADSQIYASSIAVYREYSNPNGATVDDCQATLVWETNAAPLWCAGTSIYSPNASDPAALGKAVARVGIRNAETGIITPGEAVYDATAGAWRSARWSTGFEPDRVEVRYLAGLPLVNGQMDRTWQEVLTYLALAELEGPICACASVKARLHHWQFDLARTGGANDESYAISPTDLDNPFGTRRGHVHTWKRVRDARKLIGYSF